MQKIFKIFYIILVISIISLNAFTFFWLDDFGNLLRLRKENWSVFQSMLHYYFNWDGRNISLAGFWKFFTIKYFPVEIITTIYTIFFIFNNWLIYKICYLHTSFNDAKNKYFILIYLTLITFYGFYYHISETVFWAGGGFYILSSTLGLLWLYYHFLIVKKAKKTYYHYLLYIFLSLITGSLSHNLSCGLIFFSLGNYFINKNKDVLFYFLGLLGLMLGTLIISLAPGNFIRAAHGENSFSFNIYTIISDFIAINKYYIIISKYLIVGIILLYFIYLLTSRINLNLNQIFKKIKIIIFNILPYLLALIGTILPFLFLRGFNPPRASIFFQYFLILIFISILGLINKLQIFNFKKIIQKKIIFITILILLIHTLFIGYLLKEGYRLKEQIKLRENLSIENKGKSLEFKKAEYNNLAFTYRFIDLSDDTSYWSNKMYAKYYNLKSVRIIK